jgi:hypothetical protein
MKKMTSEDKKQAKICLAIIVLILVIARLLNVDLGI